MSETFKAFITKHVATRGIYSIDAELMQTDTIRDTKSEWDNYFYGEGRDWHRTWDSAVAKAEKIRSAKIASLQKSIRKLERITWVKPQMDRSE